MGREEDPIENRVLLWIEVKDILCNFHARFEIFSELLELLRGISCTYCKSL